MRQGVIAISGSETETISSEDDLAAQEIVLDLQVGGYLAQLQDGWFLEKLVASEWTQVRAELTSTNPYPFTITEQSITDIALNFKAGNDIIEMNHGRVRIKLNVEDGPYSDHCTVACSDPQQPQCLQQYYCQDICRNLGLVFPGDGPCAVFAQTYTECARTAPGASYVCSGDYPVAGACQPIFDAFFTCVTACPDSDKDGVCRDLDCDDNNPMVGAGTRELCGDGIDQDCDGTIDENCPSDWTCTSESFGNGICDCGCGRVDFDCPSAEADVCVSCSEPGSCGSGMCPSNLDPADNSKCL